MEKGSDVSKREAKEQVPSDRIKEPPTVAREFRWRVKQLLGEDSADEAVSIKRVNGTVNGAKRKRGPEGEEEFVRFRHFAPRTWAESVTKKGTNSKRTTVARRPDDQDTSWAGKWADWDGVGTTDEHGESEAVVGVQSDVVIKIRRTERGLERQRIERTIERWDWDWEPQ